MKPSTLLLGLIFSYLEPGVGGGEDYSAQWAEYYRSIGKVKEAEAIEAQMRLVLTHSEVCRCKIQGLIFLHKK